MVESNLERIVADNELKASSILLPMIPTVLIGSASMALGQDYASDHLENVHWIVAAGMGAQVMARNVTYVVSHAIFNRKRLIKNNRLDWKRAAQDAASFFTSSNIGYFVWAGSCVAVSEFLLYKGYSPIQSGFLAGISTGSVYALFMGGVAPKIDSTINLGKKYAKKLKNHLSDNN